MLNIFQQARAAEKGKMSATSTNSIKNQFLAQTLIRSHKQCGLDKSVAQGFLKKMLTPYGSLIKLNKVPL